MNNGLKLIIGIYITITTTITASTIIDVNTVTKLDDDINISTNITDNFIIDNCGDLIGNSLIDTCTINYNGDITTSLTQLDKNSPIIISSTLTMNDMSIDDLSNRVTKVEVEDSTSATSEVLSE